MFGEPNLPRPPKGPPPPRWTRRGPGGGPSIEPLGVGPKPKPSLSGAAAVDPRKLPEYDRI